MTQTQAKTELIIVMPAYNEQASIRKVITEWFQEIENWTENFTFLVIDDGSADQTHAILQRLQEKHGPRLEVYSRNNKGHGQTCLEGYHIAIQREIPYILQLDSDGQCDPQYFFRFWRQREKFDVIYGNRKRRDDGLKRVIASLILKLTLLLAGRVWCIDANVPYRLMRTSLLPNILPRISPTFFLANVALAVLLKKNPQVRHHHINIRFRERYGGEPSVPLSSFSTRARQLVAQLSAIDASPPS